MTPNLDELERATRKVTRFGTDGREDSDGGGIEWQSMSPTTFATYDRKSDRDWYRDAPETVLALIAHVRELEAMRPSDRELDALAALVSPLDPISKELGAIAVVRPWLNRQETR